MPRTCLPRCWSGCRPPPARWSSWRPSIRRACSVSCSSVRRLRSASPVGWRRSCSKSCSRPMTAGQRRTSTSGAATTAHTSSSSSAKPSRKHTPRNSSRMASAGAWIRTRRAWRQRSGRRRRSIPATFAQMCASIHAPTLVIQGTDERLSHVTQGIGLARTIPRARLELIDGGGHMANARDPVRVNLLIREFIERSWEGQAMRRPGRIRRSGARITRAIPGRGRVRRA